MKLEGLLSPRSIALVGASPRPENFSNRLMVRLANGGYTGLVYPINPKYQEVLGWCCYPTFDTLPHVPDLAVITVAAPQVQELVAAGADAGIRNFAVLSASFGESGKTGKRLQEQLSAYVRSRGLNLLGPNAAGHVDFWGRAVVTFSSVFDNNPLVPGPIGVIAQSGGLGTLLYELFLRRDIGFSWLITSGNEAGLDAVDYIDHMIDDPNTKVIALYLEQIRRGKSLMESAQRALQAGKPIVILKAGRSPAGSRAALSHTGSLVGDRHVTAAALRQAGIIQVDSLTELVETCQTVLCLGNRAIGECVGILAVTGGLGVTAADAAANYGFEVPLLSPQTRQSLSDVLPPFAGISNPVDPTPAGFYNASTLQAVASTIGHDPLIDQLVVVNTFSHATARSAGESLLAAMRQSDLLSTMIWLAGSAETRAPFSSAGIPYFDEMDSCFRTLARIRTHQRRRFGPVAGKKEQSRRDADLRFPFPSVSGIVTEDVVKALLATWGIPVTREALVRTPEEAAAIASEIGFPVAVKVVSPDVAHKAKAGGVRLGLTSDDAVRTAAEKILTQVRTACPEAELQGLVVQEMVPEGIEVLVGMTRDPIFGPVLACGPGGVHVEAMGDVALRILPISHADALEMLGEWRAARLLEGRNREALAALLVQVSDVCMAWGDSLRELDLNPVILYGDSLRVVDGLAVVDSRD